MPKPPAKINIESGKVIAAMKAGQKGIVEDLYDQSRGKFLHWARRRFYATKADIEDAWQEASATFYLQVKSGKLTVLKCAVETYMFSLGRYWLLKNERKLKRIIWKDSMDREIEQVIILLDDPLETEKWVLRKAMEQLSEKCQKMLADRHFHDLTIQEMMELYKMDDNNVSVNLSQCLRRLKNIIKGKKEK